MKKVKIVVLTALLFFLITIPCRQIFNLSDLTEVRPASAFPPAFGMLFGIWGALGCAIGNFAADILSGYALEICIPGFLIQLLYGYLPYIMWFGVRKKREKSIIRMKNVRHVVKYIGIVFVDSLLMAVMLGVLLEVTGMGSLFSQSSLLLFFNNLVFCLILGIPIMILADLAAEQEKGQVLTLNVRFVLIFLLLSVVSAVLMGVSSYGEMYHYAEDKVALWNRIYIQVSVDFFTLCGISICFLWYLEKNITVPIERLAELAGNYADRKKLAEGKNQEGQTGEESGKLENREFAAVCDELSCLHGETGHLAAAFKKMMQDVEYYIGGITRIAAEKERIHAELQVASQMQADMLPDSGKILAGSREFTLCAKMLPAKEMGGDFYDFFMVDEDNLAFLVADVSGKGVPAALFMVVAKTLLKNRTRSAACAAQAFTDANEGLCQDNYNDMFVTAWMGVLTISTGRLVFVNAGHTRPLIRQKNGSYTYLTERSGFVLAGMEDVQYTQQELYLKAGDALFLYTDGVTEANNTEHRLYGEERLAKILNKEPDLPPQETLNAVWEDVMCYQGEAEQFDDITMLAFYYKGNGYQTKTGKPDMAHIEEWNSFVDGILKEKNFPQKEMAKIRIAVDEIFSNICYYSKAKTVTIGCRVDEEEAMLYFEDDGIPYNPLNRPDPDISESAETRKEGGLGIYLVKKRMDSLHYEYVEGKNRLTMVKNRNAKNG
ncbi:MAG: SpoIIE family protein phosphatase [Lachnospiraceae bacterium]|nr:SpoIIE family protein phosphatase [Lachnospiraceae bacterium]